VDDRTCQQNVINENYEDKPYAARTLCPVSEIALCYGSLVPQESKTLCLTWQPCAARIKDLMSFYYGPTFTVLVKLRTASASASSTTEEQLLVHQGMRNVRNGH